MKIPARWIPIAALTVLLALLAGPARAQGRTDAAGNLKIVDVGRDRDAVLQRTTILQNVLVHGNYDSTGTAIDTRGWTQIKLIFYPTFVDTSSSSNRVYACVLGVSVRGSTVQSQDSLSATTWVRWKDGAAGCPDSVGSLLNTAPVSTAVSSREFAVNLPLNTGYPRGTEFILVDAKGAPWSSPWMSVRIHPVFLNLSGTACTAQRANFRVDAVGYR